MKLLIVLSIDEYRDQVAKILEKAGVNRFSATHINGYKQRKANPNLNWFSQGSGNAKTNSVLLFSFTTKEVAEQAIAALDTCNIETQNPFPVHAFILDVESYSKLI
ncbi:MAG: hypothetical protein LKI39_10245 [Bacteroides sp.]|jgi:nitrogen regulatory protein PII|nr:hypothetical protein [Bacteroides sp.]MCI1682923.1 hypothetical protein [Bacteroides sp.]